MSTDWSDFETAGKETRELLQRLDLDRDSLRGLVEGASKAVAVGEGGDEVAITLSAATAAGGCLRLHLHRGRGPVEPHTHSRSFSVRILAGRYRHTWYERVRGTAADTGLMPYLTREELPGNTYTLHRNTVHSVEPAPDTVALVLSEMPDEVPARKGTVALYEETVASLKRLDVI